MRGDRSAPIGHVHARPPVGTSSDEGLARVVTVAYETPEVLTTVEWERASNYMYMQFNAWEYVSYVTAEFARRAATASAAPS